MVAQPQGWQLPVLPARIRKSQSWSRAEDTLELRSKPDLSQVGTSGVL